MKRMIQSLLVKLGLMNKLSDDAVPAAESVPQSPSLPPASFLPEASEFSPSPIGEEMRDFGQPTDQQ